MTTASGSVSSTLEICFSQRSAEAHQRDAFFLLISTSNTAVREWCERGDTDLDQYLRVASLALGWAAPSGRRGKAMSASPCAPMKIANAKTASVLSIDCSPKPRPAITMAKLHCRAVRRRLEGERLGRS